MANSSEFFESNFTFNNVTELYINEDLKQIEDILVIITTVISMIAMGADICWNQIWQQIRRPFGILIGLFCQFIFMPLVGFVYRKIFRFESEIMLGLLIISCCPSGLLSNQFTYYLNGNLSLSISVSVLATILALAIMPINIWIYSSGTEAKTLVLPYGSMALSLVIITSPMVFGMAIKWKLPRTSVYVTKWGSILSILTFTVSLILEITRWNHINIQISFQLILTILLMPITGMLIGYFVSFICRRSHSVCSAIAVETGVQNAGVGLNIILLSFDNKKGEIRPSALVQWFYSIAQLIICCLLYIIYRVMKRIMGKKQSFTKTESKKTIECTGIIHI